jgi:hypothetical protein
MKKPLPKNTPHRWERIITMKRILFAALIYIVSIVSFAIAQEQTLFGNTGPVTHGGFGGPVTKITQINGEMTTLGGVRGCWIINHAISLGFGGYGLGQEVAVPDAAKQLYHNTDGTFRDLKLIFGYGGFETEYTGNWENLLHYTAGVLIGAGNVEYAQDNDDWDDGDFNIHDSVFVLEPALNSELNVTRWMRINTGVSYRFVSGVNAVGLDNDDFDGFAGVITLKFGKF